MKTYSSAATTLFSVSALFGSTVSVSAYDGAYIHNGCSLDNDNYPVYDINGAMGPAWYCNDGGDISGGTDQALIHEGCVFGVHYEPYDSTWYCKDDRRGVPVDLAYIHTGCNDGVEWMTNSDCQGRYGYNCAFGDLPGYEGAWYCKDQTPLFDRDPSDFDAAFIKPGCSPQNHEEPRYASNVNAWYCGPDNVPPKATNVLANSRRLLRGETSLTD
ncbi:hypothetical protein ACHAWC_008683 [Mediolabrus comicus]